MPRGASTEAQNPLHTSVFEPFDQLNDLGHMVNMTSEEREEVLLDAASELFVRFGYDRTSIGEIAAQAGVSKGAVYLTFESKDDLFESLLLREMFRFSQAWFQRVDEHPRGGTIGAMYEAMLRALDVSPFVGIIYRRDRTLLGRYLKKPNNFFRFYGSGQPSRHEVIALLQEAGAVRKDVDARVVAHIINMFGIGLLSMDELVPQEDIPPTDDVIRGIAAFMDRAFTPDDGENPEAGKQVMRTIFAGSQERFEQLLQERRNRRSQSGMRGESSARREKTR